jgi:hypothetical protein
MEKYTKIFEEVSNDEWRNYCTIISYDNGDNGNDGEVPSVYLCNNERQGFIILKKLIFNYKFLINSLKCLSNITLTLL